MCLDIVFEEEWKNFEIKKLETDKKGYIIAWKTTKKRKNIYYTPVTKMILYKGKNTFSQCRLFSYISNLYYKGGTHLFASKKDAEKWLYDSDCEVIKCKVKKEWINNMGIQRLYSNLNDTGLQRLYRLYNNSNAINATVLVCSKAILPKYISNSISKYIYLFKKCLYKFCREVKACA